MKDFFTQKIDSKTAITIISGALLGAVLISYGIYSYKKTVRTLSTQLADVTDSKTELENKIKDLEESTFNLKNQMNIIEDNISLEQKNTNSVTDRVSQIVGTVDELKKLSETDPELLKKYSKIYFLNEHYVPLSLTTIDSKYTYTNSKPLQIHTSVYPYFTKMIDAANTAGLSLRADSVFRSFSDQATLKSAYKVIYGAGTANQFSADQGYSEHQLGTAVDFTADTKVGGLTGFDKRPEYVWMQDNAYKYGFVLSYPPNNTYYVFESWHWRFVGVALATKLHNENTYFYNMDQRTIDSYLPHLFD